MTDGDPEQAVAPRQPAEPFALPSDFTALAPKERREIVWELAQARSGSRDSLRETIAHSSQDGDPAAIPTLAMALEADPDRLVKRHAAFGLGRIADEAVVAPLIGALGLPDRATKGHAILALGRLKAREAVPELVPLLDDSYARMLVANALVAIGDERGLAPLRQAATCFSPVRRINLQRRVRALEAALGHSPAG
jgi:HEAT repeat protein